MRVVRGEGMPQYRNPFEKGDLYIKFDVQFPSNNWISPEKLTVRVGVRGAEVKGWRLRVGG